MAEVADSESVSVELVMKVMIDYEEFYLTERAAQTLRDELNMFLNRM